jgi:hypothetical protein
MVVVAEQQEQTDSLVDTQVDRGIGSLLARSERDSAAGGNTWVAVTAAVAPLVLIAAVLLFVMLW